MQDDHEIATRLLRLLDAGAAPITFEEVLGRTASDAAAVPKSPGLDVAGPAPRTGRRAPLRIAVALFVVVVVGLVVVWRVDSSQSNPSGLPVATPLSDSVLVFRTAGKPLASDSSPPIPPNPWPYHSLVVAIDPATGERVPVAGVSGWNGSFPYEFGTPVRGGGAVVLVASPPPTGRDVTWTTATAVALLPGSTAGSMLGPAIGVFAGLTPGTVWLWSGDAYKNNAPVPSHCSIREATTGGKVIEGPVPVDCNYAVLGATSSGLLLESPGSQGNGIPVWIWDPRTGQSGSAQVRSIGGDQPVNGPPDPAGIIRIDDRSLSLTYLQCVTSCRVAVVDAATSRSYALDLRPVPRVAMPDPPIFALSPNGRYIAVEEVAPSPRSQADKACESPCSRPVAGELDIFSAETGRPLLERKLSLYRPSGNSPPVVWSPDGSWVFVPATNRSIDAVPAFSATAPVKSIDLAHFNGLTGVSVEDFLVTSRR